MSAPISAHDQRVAADVLTVAPIGVFDWELTESAPRVDDPDRFLALRFLVRLRGQPIGWIYLGASDEAALDTRLQGALEEQLGATLQRAVLRLQLDASAPRPLYAPPISVIVCTRDRTDSLAQCLSSVLALEYEDFEVVVVDNAPSSDATARLVARLCDEDARAKGRLRRVVEPTPGLDWARNRGAGEARHAIIAYTDDDVRVDRRWLRAIGQAFTRDAVQCVCGLVVPGELETDAQVVFEDFYGGMGKGMHARDFRPSEMDEPARIGAHHLGVGANIAVRREWLDRLGGFDTALDVGTPSHGGGDLDILHRTIAAGGVVRYESSAIVRHYHRRTMRALRKQLRDNGRAFGVYLLSRAQHGAHSRTAVGRYALGTWIRWMLGRILRRMRRQEKLSLPLQFEECLGALEAPSAWRQTYAHDRQLRARDASRRDEATTAALTRAP